ncbi:GapA-binding peptide SR1P [Caldalkalibacillus mannanilyticus]|nr:GapA-binding peptide SR1P [Caldalkalibacillus mannanilyticus]
MGILVCQTCERAIDHFEDEKVSRLYTVCPNCHQCKSEKEGKKHT